MGNATLLNYNTGSKNCLTVCKKLRYFNHRIHGLRFELFDELVFITFLNDSKTFSDVFFNVRFFAIFTSDVRFTSVDRRRRRAPPCGRRRHTMVAAAAMYRLTDGRRCGRKHPHTRLKGTRSRTLPGQMILPRTPDLLRARRPGYTWNCRRLRRADCRIWRPPTIRGSRNRAPRFHPRNAAWRRFYAGRNEWVSFLTAHQHIIGHSVQESWR